MKLHLPSRLRQALLTCLASLASLTPATLASGALGYTLITTAWAADEEEDIIAIPEPNTLEWTEYTPSAASYTMEGEGNVKLNGGSSRITLSSSGWHCENLWFSGDSSDFLLAGGATSLLSGVSGTIYLDGKGLFLNGCNAQTFTANISIGATGATGLQGGNMPSNAALFSLHAITTSGDLEMRADAIATINGGLTVGELQGNGSLTYVDYSANGLILTKGGANYGGAINIWKYDSAGAYIKLGDAENTNVTLQISGLQTSGSLNTTKLLYIQLNTGAESGTLRITGNADTNIAGYVEFADKVELLLTSGAVQTFTNSSLKNATLEADSSLTLGDSSIAGTLTSNGGTLVASGGVVDLSAATLEGSGLRLELNIGGNATLKLADGIDLSSATMVLTGVDLNALSQTTEYRLLSSDSTYEENLLEIIDQSTLKRDITLSYEDGVLTATVAEEPSAAELVWSQDTLTWQEGDTKTLWNSEDEESYFRPMDDVSFDASALKDAMAVTVKGAVHAGSMTVSGGEVEFSGEGTISAASLTVEAGATATFDTTASFADGATVSGQLVLTNLSAWSGTISGSGTLKLVGMCGSSASLPMEFNTVTPHLGEKIGAIHLAGNSFLNVKMADDVAGIAKVTKWVIDKGSTLHTWGWGSYNQGNKTATTTWGDKSTTIAFEGTGTKYWDANTAGTSPVRGNMEGALMIGGGTTNNTGWVLTFYLNMNFELTGDAQLDVGGEANAATVVAVLGSSEESGTWDGGGHTLTQHGKGVLKLGSYFTTKDGSTGAIYMENGSLLLQQNEEHASALKNYSIRVANEATVTLGGDDDASDSYTIKALSGEGEVSGSGTLVVSNEETGIAEDGSNTFSGTLSGVTLEVAAGYQALAGSCSTATVSGAGTLDVSQVTDSLNLTVKDTVALTGLQLTASDRITVEDGVLTLSGANSLILSKAMLVGEETPEDIIHFTPAEEESETESEIESVAEGALSGELDGVLSIDLSEVLEGIVDGIAAAPEATTSYHITNVSMADWTLQTSADLFVLGVAMRRDEAGNLVFAKAAVADDGFLYVSEEGKSSVGSADGDENVYESEIGKAGAVHVKDDLSIDLRGSDITGYEEDGLTLHNTVSTGGSLTVQGKGSGKSKITLSNTLTAEQLAEVSTETGVAIDDRLTIAGDITLTDTDLQINHKTAAAAGAAKTDSATQVNGNLTVDGGKLELTSGILELRGAQNVMNGGVEFHGTDGQLILNAAQATLSGAITGTPGEVNPSREHIRLENGGVLTLDKGADVGALTIGNTDALTPLAGTVAVAGKAQMAVGSRLQSVVLQLNDELTVDTPAGAALQQGASWQLAGLEGSGKLTTAAAQPRSRSAAPIAAAAGLDIDIEVAGGDRIFTGSLSQYTGTMNFIGSHYTQYFRGVSGGSGWSVVNGYGSSIVFDLYVDGTGPNFLRMGNLTMEEKSSTTILVNVAEGGKLSANTLRIDSGAEVTIQQCGGTAVLKGKVGEAYTLAELGLKATVEDIAPDVRWHLINFRNATINEQGQVIIVQDKYLTHRASNANSSTGATLMSGLGSTAEIGGELAGIDTTLLSYIESGKSAQADRALAAVAGASLATLGQAAASDLERQLRSMRQRAATQPLAPANSKQPPASFSFWLNAEANYAHRSAEGLLPGYKLNGWGGTVGFSVSQKSSFALGLALSAMYNDLESGDADHLKADLDTYYVTGFAKSAIGNWQHTLLCSIGWADTDLRRTVNYGTGAYSTQSSTSGSLFGALYELGYTISLPESSLTWQPVVSLAWSHSKLEPFMETGSDAALSAGNIDYNAVTLSAGTRLQAIVGQAAANRSALLNARLLLNADLADRHGKADVGFATGAARGRVISAQRGAVGIELGAGISLPITTVNDIFIDLSADLYRHQSDFTATLGYRLTF